MEITITDDVFQLLKVAIFFLFIGFMWFVYEHLKAKAKKKWGKNSVEITIDLQDYTADSLDDPNVQKSLIEMIKKELSKEEENGKDRKDKD